MRQRKLISPSFMTAIALQERIKRFRPNRQFEIYGVDAGYQVVEIRKVGWWGGVQTYASRSATAAKVQPVGDLVTVRLPLAQETKAYLGVEFDGKVAWFGKTTVSSFEIDGEQLVMTLPRKVAAKRGIERLAA
jgi:hypothetical protein